MPEVSARPSVNKARKEYDEKRKMQHMVVESAPHPYPLPVKNGERGRRALRPALLSPSSRGEDAGRQVRGSAQRYERNRSDDLKAKLGMSPIAWWNDDLAELSDDVSLEECLRQSRSAGFTGMEMGRRFPE